MLVQGHKMSTADDSLISDIDTSATNKHTIPVIDRMMDLLAALEQRDTGMTISDLTAVLKQPRTSVYRILNTLQGHDVVRRDDAGAYHLGARLLTLASHVASRASDIDLVAITQPFL